MGAREMGATVGTGVGNVGSGGEGGSGRWRDGGFVFTTGILGVVGTAGEVTGAPVVNVGVEGRRVWYVEDGAFLMAYTKWCFFAFVLLCLE